MRVRSIIRDGKQSYNSRQHYETMQTQAIQRRIQNDQQLPIL